MMPTQRLVSSYNLHFERQGTSMREMLLSKKRDAFRIKITNTQSKSAVATGKLTKWLDKYHTGIRKVGHEDVTRDDRPAFYRQTNCNGHMPPATPRGRPRRQGLGS